MKPPVAASRFAFHTTAFGRSLRRLVPALVSIVAVEFAAAQTRVNPQPVQRPLGPRAVAGQSGQIFDANPLIGSGGYNYARPTSPLSIGNLAAEGQLGRGLSFQGFSPIPSVTGFRGPLGSGRLSGFRRDSVSVADVSSPVGGLLPNAYYDPSTTVPTAGFLSGQQYTGLGPRMGPRPLAAPRSALNLPRGAPGPLDLRLDQRIEQGFLPASGWMTGDTGAPYLRQQITGLVPGERTTELSSSIFGPLPARRGEREETALLDPRLARLARPLSQEELIEQRGQYDVQEPLGTEPLFGTPDEYVQRGQYGRVMPDETDPFAEPSRDIRPLVLGPVPRTPALEGEGEQPTRSDQEFTYSQQSLDRSMLPGYDKFTDLQLAFSLAQNPNSPWYEQVRAQVQGDPQASGEARDLTALTPQEFVDQLLQTPLATFAGAGDSALNNEMLKAESLLEIGEYTEAARRYEVAHRLAPLDPLPLIGKGHAYLASGEYASAIVSLLQGFERFPELSRVNLDLRALMGGGERIDIRRSDLARMLETRESAQLEFLLGYLEYFGGNKTSGMQHLERAAELDHSGSIISRFPSMIRGEGQLPPPRLPGGSPTLPEESQSNTLPGVSPTETGATREGR